jgi:hypothetical protein
MHLSLNEEGFSVTLFLLLLCLVLDLIGAEETGSWDLSAGQCLHDTYYDSYSKSDMFFSNIIAPLLVPCRLPLAIFDFLIIAVVCPQPRRIGESRSMRCGGMLR